MSQFDTKQTCGPDSRVNPTQYRKDQVLGGYILCPRASPTNRAKGSETRTVMFAMGQQETPAKRLSLDHLVGDAPSPMSGLPPKASIGVAARR
jgi:hypothetical protein